MDTLDHLLKKKKPVTFVYVVGLHLFSTPWSPTIPILKYSSHDFLLFALFFLFVCHRILDDTRTHSVV